MQANGWTNVPGTSDKKCPNCSSWKEHWEKIARELLREPWPKECAVDGCDELAEDGGHMHQNRGPEYIVPLCKKCNNQHNTSPVFLKKDTIIVSANDEITCNRYAELGRSLSASCSNKDVIDKIE